MSEELKLCPYCGEPFNITKIGEGEWLRYFVKHNGYCLMAYHFENVVGYTDIDLVTKELNTRPIEDALYEQLVVLQADKVEIISQRDTWIGNADALQAKLDVAVEAMRQSCADRRNTYRILKESIKRLEG